jgi:S1-C subfamily serine protease
MKRLVFAVFCILTLGQAGLLHAQEWVTATTDAGHVRYDLDMSSIKMNGGYATVWVRIVEPKDLSTPTTHRPYRSVTIQWLDNCANQTFAATESIYMDSANVVNDTVVTPQAQWQFIAIPPGSIVDVMQRRVCEVAAYRAALKPAIDARVLSDSTWQPASYDPASQIDFYVNTNAITDMQGGIILFFSKNVARALATIPGGNTYKTAIISELAECKTEKFSFVSIDYYDSAGNLTSTVKAQGQDTPTPVTAAPGSINEQEVRLACSQTPVSVAPTDQPQLVSGTAWLGPKGYLVTADHVVAGAGRLILGQDGKRIGTAEIVLEDASNDVAVLRPHFTAGGHTAIALSDSPARLGEKVFTLGFPDPSDMGVAIKMTSGEISATSGADPVTQRVDDPRLLQISVPVQPGNSGGPVIDESGHAVGVVLSRLERAGDHVAQNVNYALKIGYLRNLLADLPDTGSAHSAVKAGSIVGVVAEVQNAVFLIIAEAPRR